MRHEEVPFLAPPPQSWDSRHYPPSVGALDDVPIKKNNPRLPDLVQEGVVVMHDSFGRGVVGRVGLYKRYWTVWVEFDDVGVKALGPLDDGGMPWMRPFVNG